MDEQQSRVQPAEDADATQFITVDHLPDDGPAPRRGGLLPAILLGALLGLALLAAAMYVHQRHSAPVRAEARP